MTNDLRIQIAKLYFIRWSSGANEEDYESLYNDGLEFADQVIPIVAMEERVKLKQALSGYFRADGDFRKVILGALKDQINTHGDIGARHVASATRRISGQIWNSINTWQVLKGEK